MATNRCRRALVPMLFSSLLSLGAFAQIPAPGTVIVNSATSTQQVGATTQTVTSNSVAVTVGSATGLPILTKSFGASSILAGASTPLVFRLTNVPGNPAQSGITFTDTLPAGLRLTAGATSVITGAGCSAVVGLTAPSTISISAASMTAGTSVCDIAINGITNVSGANTDCSANPPAFTNGNAAISGISNASNGVTNQCLVVTPTLTVSATPVCNRDTPFVDYNATVLGVGAPGGVTITWQKMSGEVVRVLTGQPLSGRLLWPGAAVDPSGNPVAWPGWSFVEGEWIQVNDGLRPDMRIIFEVNPTATTTVSYPAATSTCNANPPNSGNVPDMSVMKSISAYQGPSPSGPYTITLRYANAGAENAVKRDITVSDTLPAGMKLLPGSLRISPFTGSTGVSLPAASGTFTYAGSNGRYQTSSSSISVSFDSLAQNAVGLITFDVTIDSGFAVDSTITNVADYVYTRSTGYTIMPRKSNPVVFKVTGSESITLRGITLPSVDPGSTVSFDNVLTNNTGRTDTFDIALTGSTFPAGTVLKLYKSDGVTLLGDSNSNGTADTGPVAAGATYKIVVKAQLPNGVVGGPFSVTKTAKSITNSLVTAADVDVVGTINSLCRMRLEPNNSGSTSPGGSIVYTHVLTNVGNCIETVTIPPGFLSNTAAGWTAQVFLDNPTGGGASIVGVLDSGDTAVTSSSVFTVPPGGRLIFLARVSAPANAANGATNLTAFGVLAGSSGNLGVTDTTNVSTTGNPSEVTDIITGFIDSTFLRPTVWGFIGRPLYLRANAPSCNADPTVIERRTIIITGPNGEREEIIATETGPNTGMFVAEPLNIRLPPVTAGNVVLEGRPYDSYDVELVGCGKKISTTVTLIDPNGVVFDSRTNQPVGGATVRIFVASGGVCTTTPASVSTHVAGQVAPAPNVVVTGSDGRYDFPLVAPGDYCVQVTPPNGYTWISSVPFTRLPAGRNIIATGPTTGGSYGGAFRVGQTTGPVILDIPVDAGLIGGLFAQKTVVRSVVEIGDLLDYSVVLKNNTGYALNQSDVLLTDTLPAGFTYVSGTARKDGARVADPQGGAGPRLVFNLGHMARDQQVKITYRVRVGPGAMQGDGVNRVVGSYRMTGGTTLYSESNVATAKVTITGGVFTDRAYIVGKVYADCNRDGVQSSDEQTREVGVPGVRLYLQDGTNVITDAEGKFSFYGLLPRAHVLKVDRTSLPAGVAVADLAPISNRHLGKGDSRMVDLKQGELHKANFAIQTCSKAALADISERRMAASSLAREIDGRLQQKLETDPNLRASNDVKALPASGSVGLVAPTANIPAPTSLGGTNERVSVTPTNPADVARFDSIAPSVLDSRLPKPIVDRPQREPQIPLETLLPSEDNSLGFIGIKDGDVVPFAQTTLRVKGAAGVTFKLVVNGKDVADDRIGKRAVFAEKQSQAWEYLGVGLAVGKNVLVLKQYDQFGNQRGEKSITIVAPGALAKLAVEFPQTSKGNVADGKTPAKVLVRLMDGNGVAVTSRTAITLSTSAGRWNVEDLNSAELGVQTFIEGGRGEFEILPPTDPAEALILVASGDIGAEGRLDFLPDLRELIASGFIEGVLNLRKLDAKGFSPTRASDGFEQEITHIARTWNGGERDAAARAAMFLKGKVKGEYLLTLAYDSDKNTRERLFRDIQPDEFYPIYGDSSVRGFDAQSTGRFYVRVDRKKSYLLYGDFNTSQYSDGRKLANYNRSLTGAKYHYESGNVSANVFASRDTTKQVIDELPANGTSGPFVLTRAGGLINSEKIEILTRDRNQPSIILRALPQSRFVDYELEPLTGRILFKAPIASLDENLNPISVRITYEIDQGGNQFWVAGGDVQVKLNERVEVGASLVDDRNPLDKFRMAGVNAIARLADKTFLVAELAQTRRELITNSVSQGSQSGNAGRIEFRHVGTNIDLNAYAGRAEKDFDNPGSGLSKGRQEIGGRITYKLDEKTRVKGEMLQTEDIVNGGKRDGVLLAVEKTLENGLRVEGGVRHARETQQVQTTVAGAIPNEVTAARVRVTGDVPGLADATAYVEAEVDVKDTGRKIAAVGADYKLPNNGRLYARHEFISSLTGPYGLNTQQRQNATVVGVSADYMKNANIFSEYRIRDAISGGDAEAALGLRNTWTLANGLQLHTGFERVHALSGKGDAESTAATFGLEYTANPLWKGSTRLELRTSPATDSVLSTIAGAAKISRDWTFLGRNTYSLQKNKGQVVGENEQDRTQLGLAYRDTDTDIWNALGRVEHRTENDSTQTGIELKRTVELVSIHANWQPRRPFTFSGRYAAKWVSEKSNGVAAKNTAHLISGRVIWDIAPRWDISVAASTLLGKGTQSRHYGLGLELGFMVMENLWVSGGYNIFGYRDDDLASGEYTSKGAFVRLRYKFDEDLFGGAKSSKAAQSAPTRPTAQAVTGATEQTGRAVTP